MRQFRTVSLLASAAFALTACGGTNDVDVARALEDVNVIDETNLNDVMLTVADPGEAVSYFERAVAGNPERIDLQRGLAKSLVRAGRANRAVTVWSSVVDHEEAMDEDRVGLAGALIRAGEWDRAEEALDTIPPTYETFERYRLEAMVADSNQEWDNADSFYEIAVGLTTRPAGVLNNWGYSKLTRGDFVGAERLFGEAISYDDKMFTAKNNLILARGAQGNYRLPPIPVTQVERAQLLYSLGLSAVKRGDINSAKTLFRDAIDTHPQHFDAAVRSLRTIDPDGAI